MASRCSSDNSCLMPVLIQVDAEEQYTITHFPEVNCFRVHVSQGFKDGDRLVKQDLNTLIKQQLLGYLRLQHRRATVETSSDERNHSEGQRSEDAALMAFQERPVYIVGHERLRIRRENGIFRKLVLGAFTRLRALSRSKIADIQIPIEDLIEIGFIKEI
jgi:KUP system potassium uptake protein